MSDRPLHEFIDLDAYDVVTREQYEKVVDDRDRLADTLRDPDYSPAYQDEYQRLWHKAAADRDRLADVLRGLAKHTLGEAFGADAGLCWCDPFYREEEWPGHDERCSAVRAALSATDREPNG